jgi:outer membrane protein assembly factor BamB
LTLISLFFFLFPLNAQDEEYSDMHIWRRALGGSVIGNPVAQVESVVAATDGGNLKSFSSQGTPLWDYYARGRLTPFVSRSREGTSYICRTTGLFIAINRSGRELWQLNLGSPLVFPVLIGWDGRLFIFTNSKITCVTAAGYKLWTRTLAANIAITPFIDSDGGVILTLENSEIQRIDAFGNIISYSIPPEQENKAAIQAQRQVPTAAASLKVERYGLAILLLYEDKSMEMIIPALGLLLKAQLDLPSPPVAAIGKDSEAAVLLKDGKVALIAPEYPPPTVSGDGIPSGMKILWTQSSHINPPELTSANSGGEPRPAGPVASAANLLFDERGVYVLSKSGATGFTGDGRRLWTTRLSGAATIPAFGDDGVLFSGGADWVLYAYHLEDRVKAKQRLLYGEASDGDYGMGDPGPSSWADYYYRLSEAELRERFSEIQWAIRLGVVGANEKEYAAYLMEVASSREANIKYRIEAASLLAYIGSRETIPFLANLFTRESDYSVKAAVAASIGRIGVDPEGLALRAFEYAILPPARLLNDEALLAVTSAIGALCRFSGPPLSDTGIRLLTILSGYDAFPVVRNQAQREIRSLGNR